MVSTPLVEQLATALEPRFCFHWAPADRAASRTERMGSLLAGVPRAPELASQSQHATMAALCRCFINVYLFADSGTVAFRQHLLVSGHVRTNGLRCVQPALYCTVRVRERVRWNCLAQLTVECVCLCVCCVCVFMLCCVWAALRED